MKKLLLPLGKGFAVIFISVKGMHAFEWLRPEAALVDPDRIKAVRLSRYRLPVLVGSVKHNKDCVIYFRHVLRVGIADTTFHPLPFLYSIILPSHCEPSQNSA